MTAREDRWLALGLQAPPILSPPYRLLNSVPHRVWLAPFGKWTTERLDARWSVDLTSMPVPAVGMPQRGDIVVWRGPIQYSDGEVREVLFPPSLITKVVRPAHGRVQVESVRDMWLEEAQASEAPDRRPQHAEVLAAAETDCVPVPPALLDLWGLDVWCPTCGHLGDPITPVSLPDVPQSIDAYGNPAPWPYGLTMNVSDGDGMLNYAAHCPRCGNLWGQVPIATDTLWPEFFQKEEDPFVVGSVKDLLEGLSERERESEPFRTLGEVVAWLEDCVVDPFDAELEPYWDSGIAFRVGGYGVELTFPFTLGELFWEARELEGDTRAYSTDQALEEDVTRVEGFPIVIADKGAPGIDWHENEYNSCHHEYAYKRKAPDGWTVKRWADTRLYGWSPYSGFDIPLPGDVGQTADQTTTLGEIRRLWREAESFR